MSKQVMDMRPGKGFSVGQSNEHLRKWGDRSWEYATSTGNYDRTRAHLNFEIKDGKVMDIDTTKSIPQRINENIRARGIKDPNEGLEEPKYRTVVNFIFGGSRDRMRELAFGNQEVCFTHESPNDHIVRKKDIERWALDVYNFVARKYGEDNIAAFIVHLDETNPHVHCTLLPIVNGKFSFKKIFAGKDKFDFKNYMISLHNDFAKVNEKWGLNRGESTVVTGARHRSTEQYKLDLSRECTSLEEQIEDKKSILKQLTFEVSFAEKRVKGLNSMIANLENRRHQLENEMSDLASQIEEGKGDEEALRKRLVKLDHELSGVIDSLSDKRQKLVKANQQLSEYKELLDEAKDKIDTYREQEQAYREKVREASSDLSEQIKFRLSDALLGKVIHDFREVYKDFDGENPFEDTLLEDLAYNAEGIMKCAAMLFAGYVDGAVSFAEGSGGGGGSTSGWGRSAEDDDREWALKCLMQATKMMKPTGSKTVKRK